MKYIGDTEVPLAVSVAQFKRATHIVAADVVDDTAFEDLLRAAQVVVVTATGRPVAPGDYEFQFPMHGMARRWWFPCRPVERIDALAVNDADGNWEDVSLSGVRLINGHDEPQLLLPGGWAGFTASADMVRVRARCGAVANAAVQRAIIRLAKEWHEADISIEGVVEQPRITFGARRLIQQARYQRPIVMAEN